MIFELGPLVIPSIAGFELSQQYQPLGGESIFRAISGRGIKQMSYDKLRVVTSASGWIPAGLESLDYQAQHVLKCVIPRRIVADPVTRQATLPTARRSDAGHDPFAIAMMDSGRAVRTSMSLAGNLATVDAVSSAVGYAVLYLPQLTVWAMRPNTSGDAGTATYRWELTCEEV